MNQKHLIPIFLLVGFLFIVYFIYPNFIEFQDAKVEVEKLEEKRSKQEAYYKGLEDLLRKAEGNKEVIEKIESAIPDEISIESLFAFFEAKGNENGLIIKSLNKIDPPKSFEEDLEEESDLKENYFALNIDGSLSSMENFLHAIEASSRIIEIETLVLNPGEDEGIFEYSLICKFYSLK